MKKRCFTCWKSLTSIIVLRKLFFWKFCIRLAWYLYYLFQSLQEFK